MNIKIRYAMVPASNYHSITLLYMCEILTSLHYSKLGSKLTVAVDAWILSVISAI